MQFVRCQLLCCARFKVPNDPPNISLVWAQYEVNMLRKNGTGKHFIACFLDGSSKAFTDGNRLQTGEDNFWICQSFFRGKTIHGIVSHSRHGVTCRNFCGFAESGQFP